MRSIRLAPAGLLALSLAAAACSSAPPPPSETPAVAPPAKVASSAPDLSPVPAPAGHFATLRVKNVEPLLRFAASRATGGDGKEGIAMGVAELTREVLGGAADPKAMGDCVALDAPIHVAAAIAGDASAPDAHVAISVGLRSVEAARAAMKGAREVAPGQWAVRDGDVPCMLALSAGATPARLVCGKDEASVVALTPYLVRTLAAEAAPTSDVALEVRVAPLDERFGRDLRRLLPQATLLARSELAIGEPKFDRAVERAAGGLATEVGAWLSDLDTFAVRGSMNPDGGAGAQVALNFRGRTSWLAGTTADMAARQTAAPAIYWQLPKDALGASYSSGYDPGLWQDIFTVLRDMTEGGLSKFSIGTPDDRRAISALIALQKGPRPASVSANGAAAVPGGDAKTPQAKYDRLVRSGIGWYVMGFGEPADATVKWLKDFGAIYARPSVQASIKKNTTGEIAAMIPTFKTTTAPASLGKGAYAAELTIPNVPYESGKVKLSLHLLVMPDGPTHFIALGADRDDLVARLLSSKSSAAKSGTLASRQGLDALRSGVGVSGGFMTLKDLTSGATSELEQLMGGRPNREMAKIKEVLARMPNHGESPVIFQATSAGQPLSIATTMTVPKGTVDDVIAAIDEMAKGMGQGGETMVMPR